MSGSGREVKRLRFGAEDDLALLREFISLNPLTEVEKWEEVQNNVYIITGKKFSIRTLKDHLFLILELWLKRDKGNQIMSGVEEIYSERDQLLQEVSDICNNANVTAVNKKRKISKEKQIQELGKKAREDCAQSLINKEIDNIENFPLNKEIIYDIENSLLNKEIDNIDNSPHDHNYSIFTVVEKEIIASNEPLEPIVSVPPLQNSEAGPSLEIPKVVEKRILGPKKTRLNKSGPLKRSALDYLNAKEAREEALKLRDLDLQKEKLDLEKKRFQLEQERQKVEILEREEKLEMEKMRYEQEMFERNQQSKIIEQQQLLIRSLLDRLRRYESNEI